MSYEIVRITDRPELLETAARWFSEKWGIPLEEYTSSMEEAVAGMRPSPSGTWPGGGADCRRHGGHRKRLP